MESTSSSGRHNAGLTRDETRRHSKGATPLACVDEVFGKHNFMFYNFARPHQTLTKRAGGVKATPAMAAGVTDHVRSLFEIAAQLDSE